MKIDAPKAYSGTADGRLIKDASYEKLTPEDVPVRIVRESDWRKIMAVVRAADYIIHPSGPKSPHPLDKAVLALRDHLAKRKADREDV